MKVCEIQFKSFKRFGDRRLSFVDEETGLARDLIVLLGANGTGKSTILQAIAATLGTATGRLKSPADLDWPGFSLALTGRAWEQPPEVHVTAEFSQQERTITRECHDLRGGRTAPQGGPLPVPGQQPLVRLALRNGQVEADSPEERAQFLGRSLASHTWRHHPQRLDVFRHVGGVYWYTEQRNHTSLTPDDVFGEGTRSQRFDLPTLRNRLQALEIFHRDLESGKRPRRASERDIYQQLETLYRAVFPERRFVGTVSKTGIGEFLEEPFFNLFDGSHEYELSEMSGGERAVFPILLDFVNLNVNHSVILIDEVELHLHPPMQQALLRSLTSLGTGNQFIVTTHSDWVADVVPPESLVRVEE